jgi:hypothetical protein
MRRFLSDFLIFCSRFAERHHLELEAFYTMKDNIINFDDFLQKLNESRELTENVAKMVSLF